MLESASRHFDATGERLAAVAFFLSGAGSLIFEIIWLYRCGLVLGNAVWATTAVLSSFMAGLAAGNAIAAVLGHRVRHLLLTYAALEATIGTTGVAVTYLLLHLNPLV